MPPAFSPPLAQWPDAGVYQLFLRVSGQLRVRVGALGWCVFPPGVYVYTGRAARALPARVSRHLLRQKPKHWHIDYLLARREVTTVAVRLASSAPRDECVVNQNRVCVGDFPVRRFGASDCRHGCAAHLRRLTDTESRLTPAGAPGTPLRDDHSEG